MIKRLFIAAIFLLSLLSLPAQDFKYRWHDHWIKLDEYKELSGYNSILKNREKGDYGYWLDNFDIMKCPEVIGKEASSSLPVKTFLLNNHITYKLFTINVNGGYLSVDLSFYDLVSEPLIDQMIFGKFSTDSGVIPYEISPQNIGDITYINLRPPVDNLLYIKKNVYVQIQKSKMTNDTIDIYKVASWIATQLHKEKWSDTKKSLPKVISETIIYRNHIFRRSGPDLDIPIATPFELKLNENIEITIECEPSVENSINHSALFDRKALSPMLYGNPKFTVKPIKPGISIYQYVLIDKNKMTSSYYSIPINCTQ